jgi:NitT/TauT family transport system substrate-binding protein
MPMIQTRRRFLTTLSMACAASTLLSRRGLTAESALETTTVRLGRYSSICFAPQYVCEALLRAEGFTDIRYVDTTAKTEEEDLGLGKFDFHSNLPFDHAIAIDRKQPITVVTGVHVGCYELFAHGGIRGIADLKGKSVGGDSRWLSTIAAYVGLDPKKDLALVDDPTAKPMELFAAGKLDAYMAFPPEVQELHAQSRPCDPEDRRGSALVAVFLLHAGSQPRVCSAVSGGDQARDPLHPESRRSMRHRARTGSAADRRGRLHRAL